VSAAKSFLPAAALPLFPLQTVLFPDGLLELKIFETRYLDLMARCMREQAPFGVVALRSGTEARTSAAAPVTLFDVGTLAELIEVDSPEANILLVRCRGTRRFSLGATRQEADGLWVGEASPLGDWIDAKDGHMRVPQGPGLGVDPDPAMVARYRVHAPNVIK